MLRRQASLHFSYVTTSQRRNQDSISEAGHRTLFYELMRPGRGDAVSVATRVAGEDIVLRRRLATIAVGLGAAARRKDAQQFDKKAAK